MNQRNSNLVHIVLRLPKGDVETLDSVAQACRLSRSAYIRKSIARNLAFTRTHELPLLSPEILEVIST